MKSTILFPIRYAADQSGLSQHVIRVWERRYGVVEPERSETNRRLYTGADIKRLRLLKKAVGKGHRISMVARMNSDELLRVIDQDRARGRKPDYLRPAIQKSPEASYFCDLSMASIANMDATGLEAALTEAAVHLTRPELINALIVPLCKKIGDLWKKGELKIVHEHLATPVIRAFLWNMLRSTETADLSPKIVVATPLGQPHELGAMTIALIACESGWRPLYFSPSLPAEEIAAAVTYSGAQAVALSLTNLSDHHRLKTELLKLRDSLSRDITILIGGQVASSLADFCKPEDMVLLKNIDTFRQALETMAD